VALSCISPLKAVQNASSARKSPANGDNYAMTTQTEMETSRMGLSTSQAARELGVSLGTVRRWADMGYLPSYRTPGGQRRFSVDQIDDFVRSLQQG
jgi:excisionase family DNA binding protein